MLTVAQSGRASGCGPDDRSSILRPLTMMNDLERFIKNSEKLIEYFTIKYNQDCFISSEEISEAFAKKLANKYKVHACWEYREGRYCFSKVPFRTDKEENGFQFRTILR